VTAIERTAYPRLKQSNYRTTDLNFYLPSADEIEYLNTLDVRTNHQRLNFMLQFKLIQKLNYFPELESVPRDIIKKVAGALGIANNTQPGYSVPKTKYKHRVLIREYLSIDYDSSSRDKLISGLARQSSKIMNDPADIINVVVETLIERRYELPSFSILDRMISSIRRAINDDIFKTIAKRLKRARKLRVLMETLTKINSDQTTDYYRLKRLPQNPSVTHFKELIDHYNWLGEYGDISLYLRNISKIKLIQFAEEARSLDAAKISAMRNREKKISLIACLLAQAQSDSKDAMALTFCRCVHCSEKDAVRQYETKDKRDEKTVETMLKLLLGITTEYQAKLSNKSKLIRQFGRQYKKYGGTNKVIIDCEKALLKDDKKHLPIIWHKYKNKSKVVISFLEAVDLGSIKKDESLLKAVKLIIEIKKGNKNKEWVTLSKKPDLSFAPKAWLSLIAAEDGKTINTKHFEACVMSQLRDKLRAGDVYLKGGDAYGDYRQALIPWKDCVPLLPAFCELTGIPNAAKNMISSLKEQLKVKSKQVDKMYPDLKELVIDSSGIPSLKKRSIQKNIASITLRDEIKKRMPERNLLDIMCLAQNTSQWASCFSPVSGLKSKLTNQLGASIVTTFAYGSGMGPSETSRHVRAGFSERTIALVNKTHVNLKKQNKSLARIVNYYKGFPLIKNWGSGVSVSVDGTLEKIYDRNLLSEAHFRYGKKGGIAYHHISDTYIALFSSLIPCGVWEAIAIIEGLLANESHMKPKKVHGDTQSQSTPVFALSYLFGIQLLPRIRNWKGMKLYKADKRIKLTHIDSLFKDIIDWKLIDKYWQDMMQIVLSIQHGKISSKVILSKLNSRNKSSQLYRAFQELGNVIRTLFLLDYLSDPDLREQITAETNKVESYNGLSDWTRFASDLIVASNDTTEMEKAIKYNTLLNNMVILQNVIDMSRIIQQMRLPHVTA
jgi:TnpA family transposase